MANDGGVIGLSIANERKSNSKTSWRESAGHSKAR